MEGRSTCHLKPPQTRPPSSPRPTRCPKEVIQGKTMVVAHVSGLRTDPFHHREALYSTKQDVTNVLCRGSKGFRGGERDERDSAGRHGKEEDLITKANLN